MNFGALRAPLKCDTVSFGTIEMVKPLEEQRYEDLREYCYKPQKGRLRNPKTEKEIAFVNAMKAYVKVRDDISSTKDDFSDKDDAMWDAYRDLVRNEILPTTFKEEDENNTVFNKERKEKFRWLYQALEKEWNKQKADKKAGTNIVRDFQERNGIGSLKDSLVECHFYE